MSGVISNNLITDGLIFYLDAANSKSYDSSISGNTVWNDLSQSQQNCTLFNSPTFDSSNLGSISFDGTNDYVKTNSTFPLNYNQITYSFWIKCTTNANYQSILSCGYQGGFGFVWFYRNLTNNAILMQYSNGTTYVINGSTYIGMWNGYNNAWIEVTAIVDYSGATMSWYRNGVLVAGPSSLTTPVAPNGNFNKYIGAYSSALQDPLLGNISNVRIYNRLLSSDEILKNYNALKHRYGY